MDASKQKRPHEWVVSSLSAASTVGAFFSGSVLLLNLLTFRRPTGMLPNPAPFVSIVVPARNEALNIEACVRSLLAQDYPNFEVVVLDDNSEDETGAILAAILQEQGEKGRLRVLSGTPLPHGWAGKNWACHQLALASRDVTEGYLLFTDADTVHHPACLRRAVAEATRDNLALLSLFPEQEVVTPAEQLVVPLLSLQILGYLPLLAMEYHPLPDVAAANGQYLLFQRNVYFAMGGHQAIAPEIAEDVSLARLSKRWGRIRMANGAGLVRCRMYRNGAEVIRGFRRSFSSGFRIDGRVFWGMVALNVLSYTLPFFLSPFSRLARRTAAGIIFLRTVLAWRTHTPFHSALGHLPGMVLLLYAQLLGANDTRLGRSTAWKGRRYELRRERQERGKRSEDTATVIRDA